MFTKDLVYDRVSYVIQILTAHILLMREMVENYFSRGEFNLGLLSTEVRKAEVNSRPRLNFTEGTMIFYHSTNKGAVNICFIHPDFSVPNRKIWKVGYRVPNSVVVTASSRVREIVKNNTHGLFSKHERYRK